VLAKPKTRTAWDHSSVRRQLFGGAGKARIFASGREARKEIEALSAALAGQLSFQEYVPGGDDAIWSFHGFAAPGGEVLEWFVGRKIRTWPALTGDSACLRLAREERLVALGRDLARRLGLAGIFKMDFKRSASSGRFYLLEINTRFNLWHYLGACSGVNLPQVAYEYLLEGRRPLHAEARPGVRWLSLHYDWRAFKELRARRELTLGQWLLSLAHWPMAYDLFSWRDPMPLLRHWATKLRAALTRRMHRWLATAS
jgi:predicted ATP-grasp superfamily ATP-dependent carboligase